MVLYNVSQWEPMLCAQNIFFCVVPYRNEVIKVWNGMRVNKWCNNFSFWVKYPPKKYCGLGFWRFNTTSCGRHATFTGFCLCTHFLFSEFKRWEQQYVASMTWHASEAGGGLDLCSRASNLGRWKKGLVRRELLKQELLFWPGMSVP